MIRLMPSIEVCQVWFSNPGKSSEQQKEVGVWFLDLTAIRDYRLPMLGNDRSFAICISVTEPFLSLAPVKEAPMTDLCSRANDSRTP